METASIQGVSACCAAALLGACARESSGAPRPAQPNVILICMDTVRADRLGCYGYERRPTTPRLDELAREATLFEDASATAGWTKPSVPSFLTGTYPLQHGVYEGSARALAGSETDVLPAEALTVAEVFDAADYATAAIVHNAQLARGRGFEQGFDAYVDEAGDAREIRWRAEDWLEERDQTQPFFLYLHFLDAHWPYDVPDEYATKFADAREVALFRGDDSRALRDQINDGARKLDAGEQEALGALYDGSLRSIDDELARLFAFLERRGAWQDTVVCVIADHGEEFLEHGRIGHGHGLYETLLRVPWILRVPGRAAARVANAVSLVDLFPTLLGAAGLAAPASEGVDRLREPGLARPIFAEHKEPSAYQQSLRRETEKLVRRYKPEREQVASAASSAAPVLGTRWEAELASHAVGDELATATATQLEARTEPAGDPLEIKGVIDAFAEARLSLHGWRIAVTEATELYGALPAQGSALSALAPGAGVKAVCAVVDGELVALRIKLYPAGEEVDAEVRGTLTEVDGAPASGRVSLSGVWIAVDERTQWKGLQEAAASRLSREEVAEFVAAGGPAAGVQGALSAQLFDLAQDPLEHAPASDGEHPLARGLDALGRDLATRRIWRAGDRLALDEAALDSLRELGYVK